jgi:hypothetical protein
MSSAKKMNKINNYHNNNVSAFLNFIDRCATELDCSETGCQTLLGIESPRIQVLKLRLMTVHLFIFTIYLMIPTVGRTVPVLLMGLLVNKELDGLYRFDCWVYC